MFRSSSAAPTGVIVLLSLLLLLQSSSSVMGSIFSSRGADYYHQPPLDEDPSERIMYEPGFWRPRWIMDRQLFAEDGKGKIKFDRLYFKMNSDKSIRIFSSKRRPWLDWLKFKTAPQKLFSETSLGGGSSNSSGSRNSNRNGGQPNVAAQKQKLLKSLFKVDGTWDWTDDDLLGVAKVKIETREGPNRLRVLHDIWSDWGSIDGYAALFRKGDIFKFKGMKYEDDLPLGKYLAGHCIIRANVHRPLISKEFQAFQY